MMAGMKTIAGCLIAVAILLLWMVTVEIVLSVIWAVKAGTFNLNWPDTMTICGWYAPCVLMLILGIVMWRRKPRTWLW
jgi:hypothetical protein